jgi:hypothetical protein
VLPVTPVGPVAPVLPGVPCGPWSADKETATVGLTDSIVIVVSFGEAFSTERLIAALGVSTIINSVI